MYVKILLYRIIKINYLPVTTENVLITTSVLFYEQFLILCRYERKINMCNIKIIKYIISTLLILTGFAFNGELFTLYTDNFQDSFYQASFAFDGIDERKSIDEKTIVEDFVNAGKKYNIDFFMIKSLIKSSYEKEITIFGNKNVFGILDSKGISQGEFSSLFTGKTIIRYRSFDEIDNIKQYDMCYITGGKARIEDMRKFKAELIDDYGGGFPVLYGSDKNLYLSLFSVWSIIIVIMMMMSLYEIMVTKRERAIRYILGEDMSYMAIKNMLLDSLIYIILMIVIPYILQEISNVKFKYVQIIAVFCVFIFINALIQLMNLYINTKKYLNIKYDSGKLLQFAYVVKSATTVLMIVVLSMNMIFIVDDINLYRQKDFFEENSHFDYCKSSYRPGTENSHPGISSEHVNKEFYSRFYENSMQFADLKNQFGYEDDIVLINRRSFEWIRTKYSGIANGDVDYTQCTYYIFYPRQMDKKSEAVQDATNIIKLGLGKVDDNGDLISDANTSDIRYVRYSEKIDLVAINDLASCKSILREQPVIILDASVPGDEEHSRSPYWNYGTIYNISESEKSDFMNEYNLQNQIYYSSGVLENYRNSWAIAWRNLRLMMFLSTILILLELGIIIFIINMQYKVNSIKIALLKINGDTLFSRNKTIFIVTLISSAVGLAIILLIAKTIEGINIRYMILNEVVIISLEIVSIIIKIINAESRKIPLILKGEFI